MEDSPSKKEINFLPKPAIIPKNLNYIINTKKVYANLYEIILTKVIKFNQYPYKVVPEISPSDDRFKKLISGATYGKLKEIYGEFTFSGDSLYGTKKVEELKNVKTAIYDKKRGKEEFTFYFEKFKTERTLKQEDMRKDPLAKQFLELIIKDILHSNPKLDFDRNTFTLTTDKKTIEQGDISVTFCPGFTTSFMETDNGNFLNVTLKNKIIQNETILEYLNYEYEGFQKDKSLQKDINEDLANRPFKTCYSSKTYKISEINFELNPINKTKNYDGKSHNLVEYHQLKDNKKIKDLKQPLIVSKQPNGNDAFFVPELCSFSNLDDYARKNGKFMQELAYYTKLEPDERVKKTNEFIKLLNDNSTDKDHPVSSKQKKESYGIDIRPTSNLFDAYYMEEPKLLGGKIKGKYKIVKPTDRTFPVLEKMPMTNWVCFYEKRNYDDADTLFKTLSKASEAFGFKVSEPKWEEMSNNSKAKDWINKAEEYFPQDEESEYDFAIFLLDKKEDYVYDALKKHSLCRNGYVSQIIKANSIRKKGAMSICSKILLQINSKLGGISYKISLDKEIKDKRLMIIGADSSHVGKRTVISMVSTIDDNLGDFYNKEQIIKEENNEQLQFCISSFIDEAVTAFKKQKINKGQQPGGIVIYRQGVSRQQKEFLKDEIKLIENSCKAKGIPFYYILVNTKTTFKFFEKTNHGYINPSSGLLIIDGITNKNYFEFYLQPQQVTQGSATPSCFHVAYGDMDWPTMIPKLTFDLCHIYSNWQGTVRIPNVIKAAEKLAKITAKSTHGELNEKLYFGQSYL